MDGTFCYRIREKRIFYFSPYSSDRINSTASHGTKTSSYVGSGVMGHR